MVVIWGFAHAIAWLQQHVQKLYIVTGSARVESVSLEKVTFKFGYVTVVTPSLFYKECCL